MVALPGDADGRGDGEEDQGPGQEHQEDEEAGRHAGAVLNGGRGDLNLYIILYLARTFNNREIDQCNKIHSRFSFKKMCDLIVTSIRWET